MISYFFAGLIAFQQPQMVREIRLPEPNGAEAQLMMWAPTEKLEVPKVSPKHKWPFDWLVSGLVRDPKHGDFRPRFRVYLQTRRPGDELQGEAARTLLRCWQFNVNKLRIDHSEAFQRRMVDVYLCDGGTAGGEQLFAVDNVGNDTFRVNTIYLYEVGSLTNRLERVRELVHEYGHATLPPFGIYKAPEDWANGDIGERYYLKWLRDGLASKRLSTYDTMGATLTQLDSYIAAKIKPLVLKVAKNGPDFASLAKRDRSGYDALIALAVYAETILPPQALGRALVLSASGSATEFLQSIVDAAAESKQLAFRPPASSGLTEFWIPMGSGKGDVKVLAKKSGWAKVQAPRGVATVIYPEE